MGRWSAAETSGYDRKYGDARGSALRSHRDALTPTSRVMLRPAGPDPPARPGLPWTEADIRPFLVMIGQPNCKPEPPNKTHEEVLEFVIRKDHKSPLSYYGAVASNAAIRSRNGIVFYFVKIEVISKSVRRLLYWHIAAIYDVKTNNVVIEAISIIFVLL